MARGSGAAVFAAAQAGQTEGDVTVQPSTVPRGVPLLLQRDPEACKRQAAGNAACVHTFVTEKPEG